MTPPLNRTASAPSPATQHLYGEAAPSLRRAQSAPNFSTEKPASSMPKSPRSSFSLSGMFTKFRTNNQEHIGDKAQNYREKANKYGEKYSRGMSDSVVTHFHGLRSYYNAKRADSYEKRLDKTASPPPARTPLDDKLKLNTANVITSKQQQYAAAMNDHHRSMLNQHWQQMQGQIPPAAKQESSPKLRDSVAQQPTINQPFKTLGSMSASQSTYRPRSYSSSSSSTTASYASSGSYQPTRKSSQSSISTPFDAGVPTYVSSLGASDIKMPQPQAGSPPPVIDSTKWDE